MVKGETVSAGHHARHARAATFRPFFADASITDESGITLALGSWTEALLQETDTGEYAAVAVERIGVRVGRRDAGVFDAYMPLTRSEAVELARQLLDLVSGEDEESW